MALATTRSRASAPMVLKRQMAMLCTRNRISQYTKNLQQQKKVRCAVRMCHKGSLLSQQPGAAATENFSTAAVRGTYRLSKLGQAALERQDLSCMYLVHHELERF